jgi:serine/threonine protein kinase
MRSADLIGRILAERYRLERVLGRGGMGVVYAGTHTWMERPVAIKVLAAELADREDAVKRFFREARIAANLRHPNIAEVLDMGEDDDGVPFIAMELLEGETLAAHLAREGKLDLETAGRLLVPIVDAIAVVHERGILHRDLKPENIHMARDFRGRTVPKLLDFGIAKLLDGASVNTNTGSVIGTPAYMAPEQLRGLRDIGPAADVWSMGMIFLRVLAGVLPVELGASPIDALVKIAMTAMPSLAHRAPGIPPAVCAVVDGALRREVEERTPTMEALLDAVLSALRDSGVPARDPRGPS